LAAVPFLAFDFLAMVVFLGAVNFLVAVEFFVALDLPALVAVEGGTGLAVGWLHKMNWESGRGSACNCLPCVDCKK
jgi:hypothetical protein